MSSGRLIKIRPGDPGDGRVTEVPFDPDTIVDGVPRWEIREFWRNKDGTARFAWFRDHPGRVRWEQVGDEFIYIVKGTLIATPEDGEPLEVRPGELLMASEGMTVEYDIREPVEAVFLISSSKTLPWWATDGSENSPAIS
jgi:uncharacterized cupin superfamily protein